MQLSGRMALWLLFGAPDQGYEMQAPITHDFLQRML